LKENNLRFSSYFAAFISEKYSEIYSAVSMCSLTDDVESLVSDIICKMYSNLYNIGIRVLVFELEIAKEQGKLIGNTPKERFDFFSEKLLTDKQYISQLHNEYKLMYSIITKSVEQTTDFVKDILTNTSEHIDEIQDKFFFGKDPGSLLYLNFSCGDAHKDGRSVTVLVFEKGNVVYKPHSLKSDQAFQTLIDYMNSMIVEKYKLRKIRTICCDGYGFAEFIEHSEVKDKEELKLFL
jgi:lantibiotic modifying enzyme